jgi:CheY-like chemotaxis protein
VVLIVNDQTFAETYKLALESGDLEVLFALDGKAGMELVAAVLPDVVVLDLDLPDAPSGLDVLTRLRSLASTRWIPVGILSIDTTRSMKKRCRSLGAVDYLDRTSISPTMLANLLRAWAAGSRTWEP